MKGAVRGSDRRFRAFPPIAAVAGWPRWLLRCAAPAPASPREFSTRFSAVSAAPDPDPRTPTDADPNHDARGGEAYAGSRPPVIACGFATAAISPIERSRRMNAAESAARSARWPSKAVFGTQHR